MLMCFLFVPCWSLPFYFQSILIFVVCVCATPRHIQSRLDCCHCCCSFCRNAHTFFSFVCSPFGLCYCYTMNFWSILGVSMKMYEHVISLAINCPSKWGFYLSSTSNRQIHCVHAYEHFLYDELVFFSQQQSPQPLPPFAMESFFSVSICRPLNSPLFLPLRRSPKPFWQISSFVHTQVCHGVLFARLCCAVLLFCHVFVACGWFFLPCLFSLS